MEQSKVLEFTIDRSTWRCGLDGKYAIGNGDTYLLNDKGFMCCLGQIAKQLKYNNKTLLEVGEPADISYSNAKDNILTFNKDRYTHNTILSQDAMFINDDTNITLKEREECLKTLLNHIKLN